MSAPVIAYIDGGARGNPGPAGYGVSIETADGRVIEQLTGAIGVATNNNAEYRGLIAALEYLVDNRHATVVIRSDSQLLTRQMRGEYRVRHPALRSLHARASELASRLTRVEYEHVPREQNQRADALANVAMDGGPEPAAPSAPDALPPGTPASGIVGVGIDIEDVARVDDLLHRYGDRFIARVFTDDEAEYCRRRRFPAQHLAGRFSAKEATMKALGTGRARGVLWRDIEVVRRGGPPQLALRGGAQRRFETLGAIDALLSITHTRTIAMAQVILIRG